MEDDDRDTDVISDLIVSHYKPNRRRIITTVVAILATSFAIAQAMMAIVDRLKP
jgi:hypothetical protein